MRDEETAMRAGGWADIYEWRVDRAAAMRCDPAQVIVAAGTQHAINLALRKRFSVGWTAAGVAPGAR
jgi:DNA-binding transcriptional MocR family regulator